MAIWRRLLAGSDWSHFLSVLSPSLFDVISARDLSKRAAELARNWFDRSGYLGCIRRLDESLQSANIGVDISASRPSQSRIPFRSEPLPLGACPSSDDGDALLKYFFLQIMSADTVFLDLRDKRFCNCPSSGRVTFIPLPLWAHWQSDFVQGVRDLYQGFYVGPISLFEHATRELGVSAANSVFQQAFGGERIRGNQYRMSEFRDTFHEVFIKCRDAKTAFHPDFVTLGVMLATLYDHLETLGGTYDVLAAYESVRAARGQ